MMEDFRFMPDEELGKIVYIIITKFENPSDDYVNWEIDFSKSPGSNYSVLAGVGEYFRMVIQLYPARFITVKVTKPGCDCREDYRPVYTTSIVGTARLIFGTMPFMYSTALHVYTTKSLPNCRAEKILRVLQ